MKRTWRHYIGNDKYYEFKSWKVFKAFYDLEHDQRAMYRIFKFRQKICSEKPELIKMFFSSFDDKKSIAKKLSDMKKKIKNDYLYL